VQNGRGVTETTPTIQAEGQPKFAKGYQTVPVVCARRVDGQLGWLFVAGWHPHLLVMGPIDMRKGVERSELWIASKVCRDLELRYHV